MPLSAHTFAIYVHYFSADGFGASTPQVIVQSSGPNGGTQELSETLVMGKVWSVGSVNSSGGFTADGTVFDNPYAY